MHDNNNIQIRTTNNIIIIIVPRLSRMMSLSQRMTTQTAVRTLTIVLLRHWLEQGNNAHTKHTTLEKVTVSGVI